MTTALIIGSGAAAAGAALALSRREHLEITVVDIGLKLESDRAQLIGALASSAPDEWDEQAVELISQQPVAARNSGIPEKRVFGSDYPFRNVGQLGGLATFNGATAALISPAYGGFSNVWGSQIMPFTTAAFESWPVNAATMRSHYEAILHHIPFAGEEDDLAGRFPLMRPPAPLPSMSPRSLNVLTAYEKHRSRLNDRGITIGKARLAFEAEKCVRCGMCMTGCPYGLIYSAARHLTGCAGPASRWKYQGSRRRGRLLTSKRPCISPASKPSRTRPSTRKPARCGSIFSGTQSGSSSG